MSTGTASKKTSSKPLGMPVVLAFLGCLAVGAVLLQQVHNRALRAFEASAVELSEVTELVGEIGDLKDESPSKFSVNFGFSSEKIEAGKRAAGISDRQNTLVSDQPRRRAQNTKFEVQPTIVEFTGVSMEQLVRFAVSVTQGENLLQVQRINLKAVSPAKSAGMAPGPELWNVELALTTTALSSK